MQERERLGRIIVVKAKRKGNGAIGGGRKNKSGKKGIIYELDAAGTRKEIAQASGHTRKDLSRNLRATGYVPEYVCINSSGETHF